jgi:hypothetical protein
MMRTAILWTTLVPLDAHAKCRYDSGGNASVTFSLPSTITIPANHRQMTSPTRNATVGGHRQIKGVCVRPDAVRPSGSSM